MFPCSYKTRKGEVAVIQSNATGRTNRFGLAAYAITERVRKNVDGEMQWVDCEKTVYVNHEGQAITPPDHEYDSQSFARQQDVERADLTKRRGKENWI